MVFDKLIYQEDIDKFNTKISISSIAMFIENCEIIKKFDLSLNFYQHIPSFELNKKMILQFLHRAGLVSQAW